MVDGSVASGAKITLLRLQEQINVLPPHSTKRVKLYEAKSLLMDAVRIIERELPNDVRNP